MELRLEWYRMPAARLGAASPLPPLQALSRVHGEVKTDDSVPESARKHLGYGCDVGILPYSVQDDYDRCRVERAFRVAVLENEILRAMFLLELGGRLWSLYHKPSRRELLYVNPVFQPGNLAVRNAWFCGGVEWNASIPGHSPLTCSPMFAAAVESETGTPILRLYEWERIRGVPYQLDCTLPDGSPWLFVQVRIVNPHDVEIPMYWWSNIAVPEAEGVRVLVPADAAYNFAYRGLMQRVTIPVWSPTSPTSRTDRTDGTDGTDGTDRTDRPDRPDGPDTTYATHLPRATDFFYDIPEGERPWIASLNRDGRGLIHTSTAQLRGRKLFVWGMGQGGRRWQRFLSPSGHAYMEIQAGLAQTQGQCLPMPPKAEWTWLEAYGLMEANPAIVQGIDWRAAREHVRQRLDETLPNGLMEDVFVRGRTFLDRPPEDILHRGSGWAALELRRRGRTRRDNGYSRGLVFDDASLSEEQKPWLRLLRSGSLPRREPSDAPGAWMVQREWRELLEESVWKKRGDHWLAWLHLGVMRYHAGELEPAQQAWERSLSLERSAWALRNLAVMAQHGGERGRAADLWLEAHELLPGQVQLAAECAQALLADGRAERALRMYEAAPARVRGCPRLQFLKARAELMLGRLDAVEQFLTGGLELPDNREGEVSLTDLWFELHEKRLAESEGTAVTEAVRQRVRVQFRPPEHIDFRMAE